jgi:ribonuclease HI
MIYCYCDASYNVKHKIAIFAFKIGTKKIKTFRLKNTNNTRAEITCLITLIKQLDLCNKYTIYTDCQSIINRLSKKDLLIQKNFKNKRGVELNNADLYSELFTIINDNINILHIKGHVKKKDMNDHNIEFSKIDKHVRSNLRSLVNIIENNV